MTFRPAAGLQVVVVEQRKEARMTEHKGGTRDRGTDVLSATWQLLDRTPKGRGDDPDGWPRRHDEYE